MAPRIDISAQELVDVLAITCDRVSGGGAPWCPPRCADFLRRTLPIRGRALPSIAARAVRLARAMEPAHAAGYVGFLYESVARLRGPLFDQAFSHAFTEGRLQGVAEPGAGGVLFIEPAMAARGGAQNTPPGGSAVAGAALAFEISYAQMPLLAAYLDIAHNMLGFAKTAQILAPLLAPAGAERDPAPVARALHSAMIEWLQPRAMSEHYVKQAQIIAAFLKATRCDEAAAISNAHVLDFWLRCGVAEPKVDGFTLFDNAVLKMMAYRAALQTAETEAAAGWAPSHEDAPIAAEADGSPLEAGEWRSPLARLLEDGGPSVKWLKRNRIETLEPLLSPGRLRPSSAAEAAVAERAALDWLDVQRVNTVFLDQPPDPKLYLTALRFILFGALHRRMKNKPEDREERLACAPTDASYETVALAMRGALEDLERVVAATAESLLARGLPAGLTLLLETFPTRAPALKQAAAALLAGATEDGSQAHSDGHDADGVAFLRPQDAITQAVAALARSLPEDHREIWTVLQQARKSLNTAGFTKADASDPAVGEALSVGAPHLHPLKREVTRFVDWLDRQNLEALLAADWPVFADAFRRLYGAPASQTP